MGNLFSCRQDDLAQVTWVAIHQRAWRVLSVGQWNETMQKEMSTVAISLSTTNNCCLAGLVRTTNRLRRLLNHIFGVALSFILLLSVEKGNVDVHVWPLEDGDNCLANVIHFSANKMLHLRATCTEIFVANSGWFKLSRFPLGFLSLLVKRLGSCLLWILTSDV